MRFGQARRGSEFTRPPALRRTVFAAGCAVALGLALAGAADATIVDYADVGGFRTFADQNTGHIWLDMDNFFAMTPNEMVAAASLAGFTLATQANVLALINSLPLTSNEWTTSYKPIMGSAPNRELIWGVYDDGSAPLGWAFASDIDTAWTFAADAVNPEVVLNAGTPDADMNIWAFTTLPTIPEPRTGFLLAVGLSALGISRRRAALDR